MLDPNFSINDLPKSMQTIASLTSVDAALNLAKKFGGLGLVYIPMRMKDSHHLVDVIGNDATEILISELKGERLDIPKLSHLKRKFRNSQIILDHDKGLSVKELVVKYDLCARQIYRVLNNE
ncbi:MAG: hypothetical protein HQL69_18905 [Magnetococcales bacterium]|nr:hypothetical protein [Magnetococcales bacterium]